MVTSDSFTTLIVEPHSPGHRLYYVRLLIEECQRRGDQVFVFTTKASVQSPQWTAHLHAYPVRVITGDSCGFNLRDIELISSDIGVDLTIIPDGDRHLPELVRRGWNGLGALNVLFMRSEVQPTRMRFMKTAVKRALMWTAGRRSRVRAFVLTSPVESHWAPLNWVMDPVTLNVSPDQTQALREQLDRYGDRYWVGVFGAFGTRKNLPLIVAAIQNIPDLGILIVGALDAAAFDAVKPSLDQFVGNGGAVVTHLGTVTDVEFDSAIATVDCVVVACETEGTSGVVLKAASAGRRLVLSGARSLRMTANTLGKQAIWVPLNVDALHEAILQAQASGQPVTPARYTDQDFREKLTTR